MQEISNNEVKLQVTSIGQYIKSLNFQHKKNRAELSKLEKIGQQLGFKVAPRVERIDGPEGTAGTEYEVVLGIGVTSTLKGSNEELFEVNLEYAGIFRLDGDITEQQKEEFLMVHGSSLIFPFARSEIAEVTLKSGVTPVMIDPVDFGKVYEMYKQQQKE